MSDLVAWVETLKPTTGAFIGSLTGAAAGLVAIILGALLNAQLNRNRDSRLRRIERQGVAAAISEELAMLRMTFLENAQLADQNTDGSDFEGRDPVQLCVLWPELADQITFFQPATIRAVIRAYSVLPDFTQRLLAAGGTLQPRRGEHDDVRMVTIPFGLRAGFATLSRGIAETLSEAIALLDAEQRRWW